MARSLIGAGFLFRSAMAQGIDVEVIGLKEAQAKMMQVARDLYGVPMLNGFRQATLWVTRDAKIFSPVDTGRLRASITPEVIADEKMIYGVVGSNVEYAPFQELGTKHMQGRRFLQSAFEKNTENILKEIGNAVAEIVQK